jgi:hypothetical protein
MNPTKEQEQLVVDILQYFPSSEQVKAIETLGYLIDRAYLYGKKHALESLLDSRGITH